MVQCGGVEVYMRGFKCVEGVKTCLGVCWVCVGGEGVGMWDGQGI